jgi:hypothetical protein
MWAVRSLFTTIPTDQRPNRQNHSSLLDHQKLGDSLPHQQHNFHRKDGRNTLEPYDLTRNSSRIMRSDSYNADTTKIQNLAVSNAEIASQLAEGTLRTLRDITLEEAMELHESLRYWTERWKSPLLSWLEAGPWGM